MTQTRNRIKVKETNRKNRNLIRLSVIRSNRYISASLIDDVKNITITTISSQKVKEGTPVEKAAGIGALIAAAAHDKKIAEVVFDRKNLRYHGQVKALAEAARGAGLKL